MGRTPDQILENTITSLPETTGRTLDINAVVRHRVRRSEPSDVVDELIECLLDTDEDA